MKTITLALLLALAVPPVFAQRGERRAPASPASESRAEAAGHEADRTPPASKPAENDRISTTHHTVTISGQTIAYTAHAGTIVMKDEEGAAKASFFFVSYTKDGEDPSKRPITFAYNGGPGSSSVWLHMGALGPKRVAYRDAEGRAAAPPYHLVDNEDSILDLTDLVFIDPVTTGYSRAIPFKDASKFHGVQADIQSVGEFIRLYTTRYQRWLSPKFLAGESYGTTRSAGLSGWLTENNYYLNGIILISSILNFETARFDTGNDLPYELFLPTYTAIAWYHKRLPADLQNGTVDAAANASEQFALGEYTHALMLGDRISPQEKADVIAKLARFTGLTPKYIDEANLRVSIFRFDKELMRDQHRTVGRLDGRFLGIDKDAAGERPEFDPSMAAISGEYSAVFNDYVRRDLKFESDLPYEILTDKVQPWAFEREQNHYLDVAETLRSAISQNPFLKVFVANGYYDLATPFAATRYTFARMQLDPELQKNVSMDFFEGGHMMYIDRKAHAKLKADIAKFMREAM